MNTKHLITKKRPMDNKKVTYLYKNGRVIKRVERDVCPCCGK